jgi:hypothetical protein
MSPHGEAPGLGDVSNAVGLNISSSVGHAKDADINGATLEKEIPNGVSDPEESTKDSLANGDATTEEIARVEVEEVGAISQSKDIYRTDKDDDGEYTWVNEYPDDTPEAAENDETAKFAIVVRKKKSSDSRKKLEADSLIVQSPWLRKALSEILKDYPGVTCELQRLIFEAPFRPFVHRWAGFLKYLERQDLDDKTGEHLRLLHDILQEEIGTQIKEFQDFVLNGVITFQLLWMIFQPGSVVVAAHKGPLSAFEVRDTAYATGQCPGFIVDVECVDWDGTQFGRSEESLSIPRFQGTRKISSLQAVPLSLRADKEELKLRLIERGKEFKSLADYCYKA